MGNLATLTEEENKAWESNFSYYLDTKGYNEKKADLNAWKDLQTQFTRLKQFKGCKP